LPYAFTNACTDDGFTDSIADIDADCYPDRSTD
jgi:hypothetical protein